MVKNYNNIYVYVSAQADLYGEPIKYAGLYPVSENTNIDDLRQMVTKDMELVLGDYLDENTLPLASIVSMSEISYELYKRLSQKHEQ